jgi:hypothetical protein
MGVQNPRTRQNPIHLPRQTDPCAWSIANRMLRGFGRMDLFRDMDLAEVDSVSSG